MAPQVGQSQEQIDRMLGRSRVEKNLMMKRTYKFIKNRRMERSHNFNNGKRSQEVSPTLKCYKCNQPGHIKANCPSNESWPEKNEKKSYKERRSKKAYIAWDAR